MTAQSTLDRKLAVPALVGDPSDLLIVAGLAGTAKDIGALTSESPNVYLMGGAMGAAVPFAFGLAYAQPGRRVLAVTGDGDLMMSIGILSTIGVMQPPNLGILCVDNGHYGETGYQAGHTSRGVDLELIAKGSGIATTHTVSAEADYAAAAQSLRHSNGPSFVWLRVSTEHPPAYKRNFDAVERKAIFRRALLGHG
jgi:thiamine pyrophosphate-dependent acetolactate synthase large subunit-like protein